MINGNGINGWSNHPNEPIVVRVFFVIVVPPMISGELKVEVLLGNHMSRVDDLKCLPK